MRVAMLPVGALGNVCACWRPQFYSTLPPPRHRQSVPSAPSRYGVNTDSLILKFRTRPRLGRRFETRLGVSAKLGLPSLVVCSTTKCKVDTSEFSAERDAKFLLYTRCDAYRYRTGGAGGGWWGAAAAWGGAMACIRSDLNTLGNRSSPIPPEERREEEGRGEERRGVRAVIKAHSHFSRSASRVTSCESCLPESSLHNKR